MDLEDVRQHEALPAVVTHVGPLPVMRSSVDPDIPSRGEPLLTDLAGVALLVPVLGGITRHLGTVGVNQCLRPAGTSLVVRHHLCWQTVRVRRGELARGQSGTPRTVFSPRVSLVGQSGSPRTSPLSPRPRTPQCPGTRGWRYPWAGHSVARHVRSVTLPPARLHPHVWGSRPGQGRRVSRLSLPTISSWRSAGTSVEVCPHLLLIWIWHLMCLIARVHPIYK